MNAPQNLIIPTLFAGEPATIRWDVVSGADGYVLERRFNLPFDDLTFTWDDFERRFPTWDAHDAEGLTWDEQEALTPTFKIYTGWQPFFTDDVAQDAATAIYRVRAFAGEEFSEFNTSEVIEISTERRPPIISGADGHIGSRFRAFSVPFTVHDPAEAHQVDVTAELNGELIQTWDDIPHGVEQFIDITDEQLSTLAIDSVNTITITAIGDTGLVTVRTLTFTFVEDTVTDAVFFVLRDGVPVARLTQERQWQDFMAVGTHRYAIRGVDRYDNFVDSNTITLTISVDFATLALTDSAAEHIEMIYGLDSQPTRDRDYEITATGTRFEGRIYSVHNVGVARSDSMSLSFLVRDKAEYDALFTLIASGKSLIYRDRYDISMFGLILNKSDSFEGLLKDPANNYLVTYSVTINRIDFNEAIEYD